MSDKPEWIAVYIYMFEDGGVNLSSTFSDEDKQCCDDGYLDVILASARPPLRWWDGEWVEIEPLPTPPDTGE